MKRLDISTSFAAHPDTGQLLIRSGNGAIQQALSNLILTQRFDRPHRPDVGTSLRGILFEQISPANSNIIRSLVKETVENNEPRVSLQQVVVTPEVERNRYVITLVYKIAGEQTATTQNISLTRIR